MPSIRVDIGPAQIREATGAAEARTYTSRAPLIFSDLLERGLSLRVQDASVSWLLRHGKTTLSLGNLGTIKTAKAARELAKQVRASIVNGDDPRAYLKARHTGRDHREAIDQVTGRTARKAGKWTFETLAARYVDDYLAKPKLTRTRLKAPSEKTVVDARYYLGLAQWEPVRGKLLSEMTAEDLEGVRDAALRDKGGTASRKVVDYGRAALTWAKRFQKGASGLGSTPPWWLEVEQVHVSRPRTRFLTLDQIARVLHVAETVRVMPGRKIAKQTSETVLCALWWVVLTAQRTGASMSLSRAHVVDDPDAPGWRIALFPAEDMKSRRYHALPLPPRVGLLLDRCAAVSRESAFVFPSYRQAARGTGEVRDIPLYDSAVALLIRRLRGRDAAGEKAAQTDLLDGVPPFSPHDLRRSLATILSDMKVRGDGASAVLDHSAPTPDGSAFQESAITRLVYNQSQRLELKREAMTAWTDAVFAACDAEWDSHRPKGLRVATVPDGALPAWVPWYREAEAEAGRRVAKEAERVRREREARGPVRLDLAKLGTVGDAGEPDPEWALGEENVSSGR